jgi:hypothetical protein
MFKIGDKLTKENYTQGAIWCNENNATINEDWVIVEIPVHIPTNEDISNMRQSAYAERTDPLTLRKMRKLALNEWTEEDETQYVAEIQAISKEIEEEYPYKE